MNPTEKTGKVSPETIADDVKRVEEIRIIPELLNVVCRTTGMRFAAVARVTDEKWVTCFVQDEINFGLKPGSELVLETTICNEIRQSGEAVVIDHVAECMEFKDHHTPAMYGFQSYISMPIITKKDGFFGTLCAIDPAPNKLDTPAVRGMFKLFSELISNNLDAAEEVKQADARLATERALHQKMEENEGSLNIVIETSELATWKIDLVTKEMKFSDRFPEILGYKKDDLPHWDLLKQNIHEDDREVRAKAYEQAFMTGKLFFQIRMIWPDGSIRWIETRGKLFFDEANKPFSMIGATRDITAEKSSSAMLEEKVKQRTQELHDKNEELEKMNRELQSFTYISSHDLQEPLRKIQTFASMIEKEDHDLPDKIKDYFRRMQKSAHRMQLLILDLLAYSRTATSAKHFEQTDLNLLLDEVKENLKEELQQKKVLIETKGLHIFQIVPFQMRQLFQNLVSNSIKFAAEDRSPHIKIEAELVKENAAANKKLTPGINYYHIRFSDNGIGFEEQYNERVFGLFQRLHGKEDYTGTGIGLAIVKKIVENHGGIIAASGRLNEGAVFDIYLPVNE